MSLSLLWGSKTSWGCLGYLFHSTLASESVHFKVMSHVQGVHVWFCHQMSPLFLTQTLPLGGKSYGCISPSCTVERKPSLYSSQSSTLGASLFFSAHSVTPVTRFASSVKDVLWNFRFEAFGLLILRWIRHLPFWVAGDNPLPLSWCCVHSTLKEVEEQGDILLQPLRSVRV